MAKVLVTGGAGFIGSHLVEHLLKQGREVSCVDNFNDYYSIEFKKQNIKPFLKNANFKLFRSDVFDFGEMEKIFRKEKFESVFHLAAKAGVAKSKENPVSYTHNNVVGTINILELSRKFDVHKIIFASSSSVYGENKPPFKETQSCDFQLSPYGATKRAAELLAKTFNYSYGMSIFGLRFFTVYGPRGRPDMAVYSFTEKILNNQEIVINNDKSSRDFTFVSDIVKGIVSAEKKCKNFELINLGNSKPEKLTKLVALIEQSTGKKARLKLRERPKEDMESTWADNSKAKKILGFKPEVSLEQGIPLFVDWYKVNRS